MWIILVISAAFFNALWTALSKKQLGEISPYRFTLIFRAITALLLLPVFLYDFKISTSPVFWLAVLASGALEVIGIHSQSIGVKKDFYSTYSLANTSPIFILFFAPFFLPEKINLMLITGCVLIAAGGVIFHKLHPHLSIHGLIRAVTAALGGIFAKIAIGYSSGLSYPFIAFSFGVGFMVLANPFRKERQESTNWNLLRPLAKKLFPLAALSMLATLSYYVAIQLAPITKVNPLVRTNLLFGFILSYYMLGEKQSLKRKIIASILLVFGGILISLA